MTLGERIQTILKEKNVRQVDFAKTLGISASYVNLLVNDKKTNISETLAKLIEEAYGYCARWVLGGVGEKNSECGCSACKAELLKRIDKMTDCEIKAVLAFTKTLETVNREFFDDEIIIMQNKSGREPGNRQTAVKEVVYEED